MNNKMEIKKTELTEEESFKYEASKKIEADALDNNYWRSFKELYNDPEFIRAKKDEFGKEEAGKFDINKLSSLSRRKFLALLSASAALAALAAAGCANYIDKGEVIPYNKKPEEIIPGIPNYYASTCTGCNSVCGILIKTREGRPIKIDGNPDHPVNKGKICTKGQASILNLYDPGRLYFPSFSSERKNHQEIQWNDLNSKLISALKNAVSGGKEIAIVSHSVLSPSQKKLFDDFKTAYSTAKIYSYELFNETPRQNAWSKTYGKKNLPVIQLDKAKVIVALESDFLNTEGNMPEQARMFTGNRDVMSKNVFNRFYAVEGAATLTGLNADYRIRLRTDAIEEFVMCLLNDFLTKRKISTFATDSKVTAVLGKYNLDEFVKKYKLSDVTVNQLAYDLLKNQGTSFVLAGDKLPESTHIAVNLLNEVLGNTKIYSAESEQIVLMPLSSPAEIDNLVSDMQSGKIGVLIHFDTNPVFHFSPDYNYADAMKKVPLVITLAENINETADASNYIIPINDQLESWGDYKTRTGFYSLQQPVIAPLYNTRQKEAVLLSWIDDKGYNENIYHDYIMNNWEKNIYPGLNTLVAFKPFWLSILHDGVAFVNERPEAGGTTFASDVFVNSHGKLAASNDFVVLLQNNNNLGDGRYANNGWLQELPNPVTKMVWDNYAAISVQSAADLGVNSNDMIDVTIGNKKQTLPVFIQPGLADKVVEVSLGYGRTVAGIIGTGVGVNVNVLISKNPALSSRFYNNVTVSKSSGTYELISTQEHHPINEEPLLKDIQFRRGIIRETTLAEYKKKPGLLKEEESKQNLQPINKSHSYKGYKWGMAIDLNKCTGCGACITACNVENNIPVVGKDQVKARREMMWIRLDRYYSGTPDSPKTNFQPMLCQHCDFAPCENVCPVAATTHSPDGLNGMAYNRCVGTRYCSNNCPYKVRRFNYFNFRDHFKDQYYEGESLSLMANPEVTVRSRGVMEKCTFCLQRIMKERQDAIAENRNVNGSNVTTACQDACPSYAIMFGDINDPDSEVSKYREHELGYFVLEEIKVAPNITYIAKLRNVSEENKMENKN
jgi:MoCo/4Fe-4S cofactor protein with predicted Tat translocation signal